MNDRDLPRLFSKPKEEWIEEALEKFYLPKKAKGIVGGYLDGTYNESALICCHSGCEICNETIWNALQWLRTKMQKE